MYARETAALTLAASLLMPAAPADARTLLLHANGITLDAAGQRQAFTSLVIGDDGRILQRVAATDPAPVPLPADRIVDAGGRTVLPGLIDAHGHVEALGRQAQTLDLSDTKTLAEAQAAIRAYAIAHSELPWIRGRGWNQVVWQLGRFPTAAELDAAVRDRPVWLDRVDGHAGWANSAALVLAGVTAATNDPPGGHIDRTAGGAPAGVLVDHAADLVERKLPVPSEADRQAAIEAGLHIMASVGLTGVGDAGIDANAWHIYQGLAGSGKLTARVFAMALGLDAQQLIAYSPIAWEDDDHLSMLTVKFFADGALGSHGAWLKAPYADDPTNSGLPFHSDEEMKHLVYTAAQRGFQVAIHAIGDAANAQALDAFAALGAGAPMGLRHRIEHAQVLDPADLPRFAALNIIASMQPTHATSDKAMAVTRLGTGRLATSYAWQSMIASGAHFAAGSDFPVEPPNPFFGIHAAVTRQSRDNLPPGGWYPAEALTIDQAFASFTSWAAYANRAETFSGTLDVGKWADFVIVDRDPFAIPPADLWKVTVQETWVGGRKVYPEGK
jgi:predicted amidohydrolase YtcJ